MVAQLFGIMYWCPFLHSLLSLCHLSLHKYKECRKSLWLGAWVTATVETDKQEERDKGDKSSASFCPTMGSVSVKQTLPGAVRNAQLEEVSKVDQFPYWKRKHHPQDHSALSPQIPLSVKSRSFRKLKHLVKDKTLSPYFHWKCCRQSTHWSILKPESFSPPINIHSVLHSYADFVLHIVNHWQAAGHSK